MSISPAPAPSSPVRARPPHPLQAPAQAITLWWTRRRVVRLANGLDLRPDLGLQEMVDRIATMRGKPIKVVVVPLPPRIRSTTGASCFGRDRDTIVVNAATEPLHRVLITLHELWHLIEDLPQTGPASRMWNRYVLQPLTRWGILQPRRTAPTSGDHTVYDADTVQDVFDALPPDLVQAVLAEQQPIRMRGDHNDCRDPAEVFARQMLQMLALDEDPKGTGSITSSFAHRRTGI